MEREETRGHRPRQTMLPFSLAGKGWWAGRYCLWIIGPVAFQTSPWMPTLESSGRPLSSLGPGTKEAQTRAEDDSPSGRQCGDTCRCQCFATTHNQTRPTNWIVKGVSAGTGLAEVASPQMCDIIPAGESQGCDRCDGAPGHRGDALCPMGSP